MSASVVVLGGPDSGKTNYIARLWSALREKKGELVEAVQPTELDFVLKWPYTSSRASSSSGRSRRGRIEGFRGDGRGSRRWEAGEDRHTRISGELWWRAVADLDVPPDLMNVLRNASGALLFLREGSDQNVQPLDWIMAKKHLVNGRGWRTRARRRR